VRNVVIRNKNRIFCLHERVTFDTLVKRVDFSPFLSFPRKRESSLFGVSKGNGFLPTRE
jgi:hypothetical protein